MAGVKISLRVHSYHISFSLHHLLKTPSPNVFTLEEQSKWCLRSTVFEGRGISLAHLEPMSQPPWPLLISGGRMFRKIQ